MRGNVGSITPWIIFELRRSQVLPGSIALRSLSIFVVPSGSRVVDLRLIAGIPRFSLAFATLLDFPRFLSTYVVSLEFPALFISLRYVAGNTRAFWISRAFCRLRRVAGIPATRRSRQKARK